MGSVIDIVRDNWLLLLIGQYPNGPLGGIACTLILSVLGIVLAFPLSVLLALARISHWRWLNWPATALIYVARGVPLLMLILWVYFLVPPLIGHNVSGFVTMLVTLVLYEGAYLAEVVRAGIQSVAFGQHEASVSLGLTRAKELRLVQLPQALRVIIPPMTNQYLNLTKNSSLAVAVGYPDLVSISNTSLNQTGRAIECIAIVMAIYLTLSLLTSALMNWYNRRAAIKER